MSKDFSVKLLIAKGAMGIDIFNNGYLRVAVFFVKNIFVNYKILL